MNAVSNLKLIDFFFRKMILKERQIAAQTIPQTFNAEHIMVTGRAIVTVSSIGVPS